MRFYEIDAGRICLDGIDAADLRREDVRRVFGMVLQRLDGPTLLQQTRTGAVTFEQAGAIVAALARSIHKLRPSPKVTSPLIGSQR